MGWVSAFVGFACCLRFTGGLAGCGGGWCCLGWLFVDWW